MKVAVPDVAAMLAIGGRLANVCHNPMVFYLYGPLGAGKTTLVRGFMRGMGYGEAIKSPTYTLVEHYDTASWRLYHLDLYRIRDTEELEYLGLREMQDRASIIMVEWPERGEGLLPSADISVKIDYDRQGRQVSVDALSLIGKEMMDELSGLTSI
jgi:tRNA threonylcarbamoyladenosine biosynthesis protein TsaE